MKNVETQDTNEHELWMPQYVACMFIEKINCTIKLTNVMVT